MKGLKKTIQLKADNAAQAESWKKVIQQQIDSSEGKLSNKSVHIKKWWKMTEADFSIFKKVADSGDLIIYKLPDCEMQPEDHPDDCYHYALVVRNSLHCPSPKIFYYDCVLCNYKICSFKDFYTDISEKAYIELFYRKIFALRDEEYFDRQKQFFECDPEIQMNTVKLQSTQLMKRLQMHAYLEGKKCY